MPTIDGTGLRGVARVDPVERAEAAAGPRQEALARLHRIGLAMSAEQSLAASSGPATPALPKAGEAATGNPRVATQAVLPGVDLLGPAGSGAPVAPQTRPAATESALLSSVGRWVDAIVRMASALPDLRVGTGRVLMSGNVKTDTTTLAGVLQRTVETTGLFYESHLGEWARGERFIENLQLEPQFDWQPPPAATPGHRIEGPPLEQVGLLAQQLNTLDQQRITWSGDAWPGQPMHWEITRNDADGHASADPDAAATGAWRTVLRLDLPALGVVTAVIELDGPRVGVTLTADNDATAARLRAHGGELVDGLAAAGIATTDLNVGRHDAG